MIEDEAGRRRKTNDEVLETAQHPDKLQDHADRVTRVLEQSLANLIICYGGPVRRSLKTTHQLGELSDQATEVALLHDIQINSRPRTLLFLPHPEFVNRWAKPEVLSSICEALTLVSLEHPVTVKFKRFERRLNMLGRQPTLATNGGSSINLSPTEQKNLKEAIVITIEDDEIEEVQREARKQVNREAQRETRRRLVQEKSQSRYRQRLVEQFAKPQGNEVLYDEAHLARRLTLYQRHPNFYFPAPPADAPDGKDWREYADARNAQRRLIRDPVAQHESAYRSLGYIAKAGEGEASRVDRYHSGLEHRREMHAERKENGLKRRPHESIESYEKRQKRHDDGYEKNKRDIRESDRVRFGREARPGESEESRMERYNERMRKKRASRIARQAAGKKW